MQEVNWDAVNLLELGMLLDMAKMDMNSRLRMEELSPLK